MIIVDLGVPSFLCTCLYVFIQQVGECLGDLQRKICRFTIRLKSGGNFRANIPFLWVSSLSFSHAATFFLSECTSAYLRMGMGTSNYKQVGFPGVSILGNRPADSALPAWLLL